MKFYVTEMPLHPGECPFYQGKGTCLCDNCPCEYFDFRDAVGYELDMCAHLEMRP